MTNYIQNQLHLQKVELESALKQKIKELEVENLQQTISPTSKENQIKLQHEIKLYQALLNQNLVITRIMNEEKTKVCFLRKIKIKVSGLIKKFKGRK